MEGMDAEPAVKRRARVSARRTDERDEVVRWLRRMGGRFEHPERLRTAERDVRMEGDRVRSRRRRLSGSNSA
jgi:hypothetical protein